MNDRFGWVLLAVLNVFGIILNVIGLVTLGVNVMNVVGLFAGIFGFVICMVFLAFITN